MNYQVTLYADYNYVTNGYQSIFSGVVPELPENVYLEEQEIMDKVGGQAQGSKCYFVPASNMVQLIELVSEFNIRDDKPYIMILEIYKPVVDKVGTLRITAEDRGWIFNNQELNKDGENCTQLIRDYLSLTIVEKDNKIQLRHWDLHRGVKHYTNYLDDITLLSSLVDYLYSDYEDGWGTEGQVPPRSKDNLAKYLVKEPALAY